MDTRLGYKAWIQGQSRSFKRIGTLDVNALYPSIRLDVAIEAIKDALSTVTNFSPDQIGMIIHLVTICIKNSVVHYRGRWYRVEVGIPTGGPESGSIANIAVYYVLDKILLIHPAITSFNKISKRKRFLDDVWFGWTGTSRQFTTFLTRMNEVGDDKLGITFTGEVGHTVHFLDVSVTLQGDGKIHTKLYVKPTDASRYLHRRSDHGNTHFSKYPILTIQKSNCAVF